MAKIRQRQPLQDPPKFTLIWIFVLKIRHLATLLTTKAIHSDFWRDSVMSFEAAVAVNIFPSRR
jgi:hypothetical protein